VSFRMPDHTHRVAINGRTGTGKTHFGAWLLSLAPFDKIPYVIVDYKRDELLNGIERAKFIDDRKLPRIPGIYILHATPFDKTGIENWLRKVYDHGKIGLFLDEAYMLPNQKRDDSSFVAILTQGRSLHIPAIVLTQRPSHVTPYVFTEADFYVLFPLNDQKDIERVSDRAPVKDPEHPAWDMTRRLPRYHSRWYDQGEHFSAVMKPAPSKEVILETFDDRLKPKRKFY